MPALTVVMPAYNEEMTIRKAIEDVFTHVVPAAGDVEFIVVDDGSKDRTADIVQSLQRQHGELRLIRQVNSGHGPALRAGLDAASGDWLLLLDSDCQVGLSRFSEHWARRGAFDAFLAIRTPRNDAAFRLMVSRMMKYVLRLNVGVVPADAGAPYKLVSRRAWSVASRLISRESWIPSVLLATYLLKDESFRVVQEPVAHFERPHGESTLNLRRLVRFCWHALREIRGFGAAFRHGSQLRQANERAD
ncbi:glycosyltransferase family 2 protein [Aestuariivirga sp.]|uniref:glycosyltransferase family 2 protein n=1 Tax=Aestuariivirga sp. TaxID=2650926 RepID=UPI00391D3E30